MSESADAESDLTELRDSLAAFMEREDLSRNSVAKASKVRVKSKKIVFCGISIA